MADLLQTLLTAIVIGSLYALIALGYTMVYGILKLINFAHADVVVLGAWVSLTGASFMLPRMGVDMNHPAWWAGGLILFISMSVCALVGLAIERFAYKPIRKAPRLNALITAMGVSLFLQNFGQLQYTIVPDVNRVATGRVIERDTDPKRVKLDQPLTLATGRHYLLRIAPQNGSAVEKVVTAEPGVYKPGDPIALESVLGKSTARDATFLLFTRQTPLKLPFGKMPASVPGLLPVVVQGKDPATGAHDASHDNVLFDLQQLAPGIITRPVPVRLVSVATVITALALMIGLQLLIFRTKLGLAMRAVSFNTDYAALMGIPIDRVISVTFVIGAALAAAAGFLIGQMYETLQQTAHASWTLLGLKAFVAAVVGGIGNVRGAVVGGFLIAFIEFFGGLYGTKFIADNFSAYIDVMVFALLILVLLVKPSGLFGSTQQEKV
jgi:branched-subunit amino acid ABC-type transport system permease component